MKQGEKKQKTIKTLVGLVIGLGVMLIVQQVIFKPSIDKVMLNVAMQMNESCPMMVDDETRLDNVVAMPGNIFQYNYTLIHVEKASADIDELTSYLQTSITNDVKTNPDLQIYRDNQTTMTYNYRDKNGKSLTVISVAPEDYED